MQLAELNDREKAVQESRNCKHCGGDGLVPVYHRNYEGFLIMAEEFPGIVAAHCECRYGHWIRSNCPFALKARYPALGDVLAGGTEWLIDDPTIPGVPEEFWGLSVRETLVLIRNSKERISHNREIQHDVKAGIIEGRRERQIEFAGGEP